MFFFLFYLVLFFFIVHEAKNKYKNRKKFARIAFFLSWYSTGSWCSYNIYFSLNNIRDIYKPKVPNHTELIANKKFFIFIAKISFIFIVLKVIQILHKKSYMTMFIISSTFLIIKKYCFQHAKNRGSVYRCYIDPYDRFL